MEEITTNRGLYLQAISTLFAASMTTLVKILEMYKNVPIFEAVLARSLILTLVAASSMHLFQQPNIQPKNTTLLLLRGIFGFMAISSLYASVQYMPLADAAALGFLSPIFITIASPWALREPISKRVFFSLPIAFLGVILIAQPAMFFGSSQPLPFPGIIFGILQSVFSACARLTVRTLSKNGESMHLIVLSMAAISVIGSLFGALIPSQQFVVPDQLSEYACLIGIGCCAVGVQFAQTAALRYAPAAQVAPLIYLVGVWSAMLDFTVFHVKPDVLTVVGMAMVIGGNVVLLSDKSSSHNGTGGGDGGDNNRNSRHSMSHRDIDTAEQPLLHGAHERNSGNGPVETEFASVNYDSDKRRNGGDTIL